MLTSSNVFNELILDEHKSSSSLSLLSKITTLTQYTLMYAFDTFSIILWMKLCSWYNIIDVEKVRFKPGFKEIFW